MIVMQDVSFRYAGGTELALQDIRLEIPKGAFVGVIGESGAGKSTLAACINGLVPHHFPGDFYGTVTVDGMDTVETRPERLCLRVGSVFQDVDGQMVASVVEDELLFGLENFGIPREEIALRLSEALEAVGIPELRYRSIRSLSGGQKQKVAIAAILALRPEILVLDEPTGELDPVSSRQVFETLRRLNRERGMTIVVVEQKIGLLCEFAQTLVVMHQGKIALQGSVREVMHHGRELERLGIYVPRVVRLAVRLRELGVYDGPTPVTVEEAETMVREVLQDAAV